MTGAGVWGAQAERVARACTEVLGPDLVGVYVHGSAALGGFGPASDLDVLVVARGERDLRHLGERLLAIPAKWPLELSVVEAGAARTPQRPWPYLLHVASTEGKVVGPGEDPDLASHYLVARSTGIAVRGPEPTTVIGPVPREDQLDHLRGELAWGLAHADQRYAVLNACRALAYGAEAAVLSKVDGARWWTARHGSHPLVAEALAAQREGRDLGACTPEAATFVDRVLDALGREA